MRRNPAYEELERRIKTLEKEAERGERAEGILQEKAHELRERVKELSCLYNISRLTQKQKITLDEILLGTVRAIPPAWQYPEITCARVVFEDREMRTDNFKETAWKLAEDIKFQRKSVGYVEVRYLKKRGERDEGPFLKEERKLLKVISEQLGSIIERWQAEEALEEKTHELRERIKELSCLYNISRLREKPDILLEEILLGTVNAIPPAWQYPEITCARVVFEDREMRTDNFKETAWKLAEKVRANGRAVGTLEVFYLEERPQRDQGTFLREEKNLLKVIAERLGRIIERYRAEEMLKRRERDLEIKTKNLEEVNTALKVLLKRREEDKLDLEDNVLFNMKELIIPYLEKLKASGLEERQRAYVGILESNLNDIISTFPRRLSSSLFNITPTEMKIADLIKRGKTTKEIAVFLNTSTRAIEFHRANLRQKLGLKNKRANLRSHLLSIS
ncbi:MAG: LuxR C-terminal-related transcriptional regulator [Desulfobacteraceae bacterium]|jgi:DNA-binding CsgD family transcriptional regulator